MNAEVESLMDELLGAGSGQPSQDMQNRFQQVATSSSSNAVAQGMTSAFNSPQTPPFGQLVAHLFGQSNPDQRSGLLNRLLAAAGPNAGGLLSQLGLQSPAGSPTQNISPEQASQVTPQQVQEVATQAQNSNPGIVNTVSEFYAQHPMVVKTLGAAALWAILDHVRR